MDSACKHDWRNGIKINSQGVLESVMECEECGARHYLDSRQRPKHLQHLPSRDTKT